MKSPELQPDVERLFHDFLGRFLRLEPIRRIIAQEIYFDRLRPFVETMDLLQYEPKLLDEWRQLRPEIHRLGEASARRALPAFDLNASGPAEDKDRLLLRLAALRRLDSWLAPGGDRIIERPHSLGGDLYWTIEIPGFDRSMKVGLNFTHDYHPDPRHDAEFKAILENELAVAAVEFALFPLAGRRGLFVPDHWRKIRACWREVAALREFDATSEIAVFPEGYLLAKPPTGMVARVPQEFLSQINPLLFLETGLCPWLPTVTAEFLERHQHEFETVATDDQVRAWIARIITGERTAEDFVAARDPCGLEAVRFDPRAVCPVGEPGLARAHGKIHHPSHAGSACETGCDDDLAGSSHPGEKTPGDPGTASGRSTSQFT